MHKHTTDSTAALRAASKHAHRTLGVDEADRRSADRRRAQQRRAERNAKRGPK